MVGWWLGRRVRWWEGWMVGDGWRLEGWDHSGWSEGRGWWVWSEGEMVGGVGDGWRLGGLDGRGWWGGWRVRWLDGRRWVGWRVRW
jgi:hypothetical protein